MIKNSIIILFLLSLRPFDSLSQIESASPELSYLDSTLEECVGVTRGVLFRIPITDIDSCALDLLQTLDYNFKCYLGDKAPDSYLVVTKKISEANYTIDIHLMNIRDTVPYIPKYYASFSINRSFFYCYGDKIELFNQPSSNYKLLVYDSTMCEDEILAISDVWLPFARREHIDVLTKNRKKYFFVTNFCLKRKHKLGLNKKSNCCKCIN